MEPIGKLINQHRGEGAAFSAAQVVGIINTVINKDLGWSPADAQATSFSGGTATIRVAHGAIAARLHQQAAEIIQSANDACRRAHSPGRVEQIFTRLGQQP
jgi:hypothetical protein